MTELELNQFLAHIFGATSSSTVTGWVLRQHAENLKDVISKEVYEIMSHFFYVDDGTGGASTINKCAKVCMDL